MVKGTYNGKITILEQRPSEYIRLRGDGKGGGNWTSGEAELTLVQQDGQTVMNYLGQGNISGQLASVGQRLVDTVGRQIVDQGVQFFAEEIAARRRELVGLPPVEPMPAMPALMIREWVQSLKELILAQRARWAIPAAVGIVALIVWLVFKSRSR
jgi:hypothetical protein